MISPFLILGVQNSQISIYSNLCLQLYLILAKIKPNIWDLNVADTIIVTVQEKVPMHLVIFSDKGISSMIPPPKKNCL